MTTITIRKLRRRQRRVRKLRKLKARLAATQDQREREHLLKKIQKISYYRNV